ncbi:hypothetical protein DPMN_166365 [Dreissena polymorpha]|uniref:Uncharacterized protein n=1 Tax=Dreissena polymorpha TaxID=45954 RepID=A0A9D4EWY2_DREPO|nr:hypothetical protein DPMN_166365 [Dreissena polymorpha]
MVCCSIWHSVYGTSFNIQFTHNIVKFNMTDRTGGFSIKYPIPQSDVQCLGRAGRQDWSDQHHLFEIMLVVLVSYFWLDQLICIALFVRNNDVGGDQEITNHNVGCEANRRNPKIVVEKVYGCDIFHKTFCCLQKKY